MMRRKSIGYYIGYFEVFLTIKIVTSLTSVHDAVCRDWFERMLHDGAINVEQFIHLFTTVRETC